MSVLTVFGAGFTQIWGKSWGSGVIANLDLTNTVYFSSDRPISTASDQIPPLGAMVVDGSRDLYASTLSAAQVVVQATRGASAWAPSPAQVALQISALGLAKDTSVQTVAGNTGTVVTNTTGIALDASVTTSLPNTLQTGGIPPYLPNAASYGFGPVAPGGAQTLVTWASGTKRIWASYITLSISTNSTFTGSAVFTAWIGDGGGNVYASATARTDAASSVVAVGVPFDSKGLQITGPATIKINVSSAVTNAAAAADGGVMVST